MSLTAEQREIAENAQVALEDGLREAKAGPVARTAVVAALEHIDELLGTDEVEAVLVQLTTNDGQPPDEEHLKLVEKYGDDPDPELTKLNAKLAKCKRPAHATQVSEDDEDFEDDVEDLINANEDEQ